MTKQEFLQRGYEWHFLDDAKAVADYCWENYEKEAKEEIAYAGICLAVQPSQIFYYAGAGVSAHRG